MTDPAIGGIDPRCGFREKRVGRFVGDLRPSLREEIAGDPVIKVVYFADAKTIEVNPGERRHRRDLQNANAHREDGGLTPASGVPRVGIKIVRKFRVPCLCREPEITRCVCIGDARLRFRHPGDRERDTGRA